MTNKHIKQVLVVMILPKRLKVVKKRNKRSNRISLLIIFIKKKIKKKYDICTHCTWIFA